MIHQFTYYKTPDNTRAFIVADVADYRQYGPIPPAIPSIVVLKEFGKEEAITMPIETIEKQIQDGNLVLFTPKIV